MHTSGTQKVMTSAYTHANGTHVMTPAYMYTNGTQKVMTSAYTHTNDTQNVISAYMHAKVCRM